MKKEAELISPGILKSNFFINFGLDNVIKSYLNVFFVFSSVNLIVIASNSQERNVSVIDTCSKNIFEFGELSYMKNIPTKSNVFGLKSLTLRIWSIPSGNP